LWIGFSENTERRSEKLVKTKNSGEGSYSCLKKSPSECDENDEKQFQRAGSRQIEVKEKCSDGDEGGEAQTQKGKPSCAKAIRGRRLLQSKCQVHFEGVHRFFLVYAVACFVVQVNIYEFLISLCLPYE